MEAEASGVMRRMRLPSWAGEVAFVLAWPLGIAVIWLLSDAFGSWIFSALWLGCLVGWIVFCLGGFARTDPIGFASVMAPIVVIAAVAILVLASGGNVGAIMLASLGWVVMWTIAGSRIWPWWSRILLRRYRRGSPEGGLFEAWRQVISRWRSVSSDADARDVWQEVVDLKRFENERTRPVIDGAFALWELSTTPGTDEATFVRASARLQEEWDRIWEPPRIRLPLTRSRDRFERPTRGTRLEYTFPRLEALVSVASLEQQRRVAAESARQAIRDAGLASPTLEQALDQVAAGQPDPRARDEVATRLESARARLDELAERLEAHPGPRSAEDDRSLRELSREAIALSAVSQALGDDLPPVAVADVVSESIRSAHEDGRAVAYEELVAEIVGPDAAARAVEIQPVSVAPMRASDESSGKVADDVSILGQQGGTLGSLRRVAIVGLAAGLIGTLVRQVVWPIYADRPDAYAIDRTAGLVIVVFTGYALIRAWLGRPSFLDVVLLFVASFISAELVGPLFDLTSGFMTPLAGQAWNDLFADPVNVAPYAPFHGLTFAAALVAASLILQPPPLAVPMSDNAD